MAAMLVFEERVVVRTVECHGAVCEAVVESLDWEVYERWEGKVAHSEPANKKSTYMDVHG